MEYRSKLAEAAGMGEAAPADAEGAHPKVFSRSKFQSRQ